MSTESLIPTSEELTILIDGSVGAGEILQRLRKSRGWTQPELAFKLSVTRAAVAKWETGVRWPDGYRLDRLIDILNPASGVAQEKRGQALVTQKELGAIIAQLEAAGAEQSEIGLRIVTYAYPNVLMTLILRCCGAPNVSLDARATALFFEHRKELVEENRLRSQGTSRNVTPDQEDWSAGKNIVKPAKTVTVTPVETSDNATHNSAPDDETDVPPIESTIGT